jgi:hypothetical protein
MIDIGTETLLTFAQAAAEMPRRRQGKRVSVVTIWRWTKQGSHGIVLETLETPSGKITSKEALARFLQALTELRQGAPSLPSHVQGRYRSPSRRQRDSEHAESKLNGRRARSPSGRA